MRRVVVAIGATVVGGGLGVTSTLQAQAICSAPHSSPVLAQGGTIQTLPTGSGWIQVSLFRQVSSQFFGPDGDRRPFLSSGRVRTHSVYLTGAVGVLRGVDVWAQVPVRDLVFGDGSGDRRRVGIGDPRFSLRASGELVGVDLPLALRAGVKLPGTSFPVDATIIPLSEGQRDWELSIESGTALLGSSAYVLGWIGYRWREFNAAARRKPGNELFTHLAIGGARSGFHAELGAEVLIGRSPRQLGVLLPSARRRLVQLQPTFGYRVGRSSIELTGFIPVSGRNLPTGPAGSVGYRFSWGG